jgi:hypothetical protein
LHDTGVQLLSEAHLDRGAADVGVEHRSPTGLADSGGQFVGGDRNAGRQAAVGGIIEADDRVKVDQAAGLKLRGLDIGDPHELAERTLTQTNARRENADQLDDEAVPQRGRVPVPQHRADVVVGRRVDRATKLRIVLGMSATAATRAAIIRPVVDRSEAWCGHRREDLRMFGDLLGDALAAASQTGVDELPHVALVLIRARRTALRAPVATAHHQRAVGLAGSRVHQLVTTQHDPTQPDRMPASPGPPDLPQPALTLRVTRPRDQTAHSRQIQPVDGRDSHRRDPTPATRMRHHTAHTPRTPASRPVPTPASASRRNRSGLGRHMQAFSGADACRRMQAHDASSSMTCW